MMIPTIHMNGTSKDALMDELSTANSALLDAIHALASCAPNGRDYYPQGPTAITTALDEHKSRLECITSVRHEIVLLMGAVEDS